MIWFTCKQCGKTHGRPETAIGATIFCDCGIGVVVPWESTIAEPVAPPPVPDQPLVPTLEPVVFEPNSGKDPPRPAQIRKRVRIGPRDSNHCFNHEEVPRQTACGDCNESFCADCLVSFEGATL